ncbi:hypothetical protein V6N13_053571 [Hibiscus sabdariffa]|uniref:Uncharacterized protein n=1 Tax=Hibiscus sabdariffa TaxID=183260 RepID=A0ABR2T7P0_9ROSI
MQNSCLASYGNSSGKPLEVVDHLGAVDTHERPGSPIAVGDLSQAKKKKESSEPNENVGMEVDGVSRLIFIGNTTHVSIPAEGIGNGVTGRAKPSYTSVTGKSFVDSNDSEVGFGFGTDNVVVLYEDCIVKIPTALTRRRLELLALNLGKRARKKV